MFIARPRNSDTFVSFVLDATVKWKLVNAQLLNMFPSLCSEGKLSDKGH